MSKKTRPPEIIKMITKYLCFFIYEKLSLKCIVSCDLKMESLQNISNYSANCGSCWHEAAAGFHTAYLEMKQSDTHRASQTSDNPDTSSNYLL